ncbi:MAG: DNRLRE domain-containing protein, partial [Candidatus Hydrogenedentes bacterium]|nr:DNRLRE domain-containing protein [Candidatus Hydrogenedentota bacterium]
MHRKLIRTRVDANSLRVREAVLTVLAAGCTCLWASPALGASGEITLNAVKDNTIYSDTVSEGEGLSNGAGASIYAGRTFQDGIRRGLVAFDLSGIDLPGGAVITGAVLNLDITRDPPGAMATDLALHRLTADWGEGVSDAGDPGGSGAPAEAGDATWKHRFFDSAVWAMDGGDFLADPSATATADGMGTISWEGEGVLADVAHWLAQPAENFGWIVVGNESSAGNARRFASRENETTAIRPRLRLIWITPETIHSADADADGVIGLSELLRVIQF